ncbi:MAG TPA: exonuclease domain-containing protein, partial [Actinotalea sp.]|nr:exonuclease domain-containing protein [Actinotalea sp.]
MRWIGGPVVGFDTETTGVDVDVDRIVTAAVVRRDADGRVTTATWLIDPGVEIPAAAAAIHGITTERARAHGCPPAAAVEEIATVLADALRRGEPVVAYNAAFDLSLLDAELRRHGLPRLAERIGGEPRAILDPLVLDRHLDRYRRGKRRLGDLCAHYGISTRDLHTADVDVLATLEVLAAIARCHPAIADLELAELHDLQVLAHRQWAEGYNHWRTAQGLPGPGAGLGWPSRDPRAPSR